MVDLILAATLLAAFYGGFRVGNHFKSLGDAWQGLLAKLK